MSALTFTSRIGQGAVTLKFSAKPPEEIRSILKRNGFRWQPLFQEWQARFWVGAADFLAYLDKRLNPNRPDGKCWQCQSPQGFFRQHGPATPVLCSECWERVKAVPSPY